MKKRLKPLEQVVEEFGFGKNGDDYIKYRGYTKWMINDEMFKYFGKEIEVFKHDKNENEDDYDYYFKEYGEHTWHFHSSWFEPYEFIKEDEFKI